MSRVAILFLYFNDILLQISKKYIKMWKEIATYIVSQVKHAGEESPPPNKDIIYPLRLRVIE